MNKKLLLIIVTVFIAVFFISAGLLISFKEGNTDNILKEGVNASYFKIANDSWRYIPGDPMLSVDSNVTILTITNPILEEYANRTKPSLDAILSPNATLEIFNVGTDFKWKGIVINFNQTSLNVNRSQTICNKDFCSTINWKGLNTANITKLTWDRENNTVVIE